MICGFGEFRVTVVDDATVNNAAEPFSLKFHGLCFLVLVLLAGCSSEPRLSYVSRNKPILAFGDSITAGVGAGTGGSYPEQLGQLIGRPVINAGVSGELSGKGYERLPAVLDEHHPGLVILCHGGNDLLAHRGTTTVSRHLWGMIRTVLDHDAQVVLIAVPLRGRGLKKTGFYEKLAKEYSIPILPEVLREILYPPALMSDTIHPNSKGYRALAERIAESLIQEGAVQL